MDFEKILKTACRIHTADMIHRYLMVNAEGRQDGALQAHWHIKLCQFYTALAFNYFDPDKVIVFKDGADDLFDKIHEATQDKLTDHLDTVIGFPLKGRPDYDRLAPLFFVHLHRIAMEQINV